MGTFSKILLSGSTDGEGIAITGTSASTGTVLHTAVTGSADSIDEVFVYAHNVATTNSEIAIVVGPTTAPLSKYTFTITGGDLNGLHLIHPGLPVRNAKTVIAFATAASRILVMGYVNRFVS